MTEVCLTFPQAMLVWFLSSFGVFSLAVLALVFGLAMVREDDDD
jgi:hypothetical protein